MQYSPSFICKIVVVTFCACLCTKHNVNTWYNDENVFTSRRYQFVCLLLPQTVEGNIMYPSAISLIALLCRAGIMFSFTDYLLPYAVEV
jgi:hypothetical protein